jgi:outer membrane protein assembly factor BamB
MRYGLLTILCFTPILVQADDWPQWLGPKRDGIWREEGILDRFPKGGPKVLWRVPVGQGYAGPSVAQGKVFVPDRLLEGKAQNPSNPFDVKDVKGKERLLCLSEKEGKELWKYEIDSTYRISYPAGPRCTPTVDGETVYFLGAMGHLAALNVQTGKPIWTVEFLKDYEATLPFWGFSNHPLVYGDKLIVYAGGSEGRTVMALDKKTGKEIWRALNLGDPGYCPPTILEIQGKPQLIAWMPKGVYGIDPDTGKKLWEYRWEIKSSLTAPTPRLVEKDQIFLTSFYNGSLLLKIKDNTPEVVWKSTSKGGDRSVMPEETVDLHSIMTTPFVEGKTVYGICSYGELRGLEVQTGKRLWQSYEATTGKSVRWGHAFLTPNQGHYYIFNEKGELVIADLSEKGFKELDRAKLIEPTNKMAAGRPVVWTHPAFANKTIFVRNDNEIVAYSLAK